MNRKKMSTTSNASTYCQGEGEPNQNQTQPNPLGDVYSTVELNCNCLFIFELTFVNFFSIVLNILDVISPGLMSMSKLSILKLQI